MGLRLTTKEMVFFRKFLQQECGGGVEERGCIGAGSALRILRQQLQKIVAEADATGKFDLIKADS